MLEWEPILNPADVCAVARHADVTADSSIFGPIIPMKQRSNRYFILAVMLVPAFALTSTVVHDLDRKLIVGGALVVTLLGVFGVILEECCRIKRKMAQLRRKRRSKL
jgi:hypothetical protein